MSSTLSIIMHSLRPFHPNVPRENDHWRGGAGRAVRQAKRHKQESAVAQPTGRTLCRSEGGLTRPVAAAGVRSAVGRALGLEGRRAVHVEAADGRVLLLLVRDGLRLRVIWRTRMRSSWRRRRSTLLSDLHRAVPSSASQSTAAPQKCGALTAISYTADLPTSLLVRLFMASVAEAIEARFGASMCSAIALDGRRVRFRQRLPHREPGQLSAA
jgi:hypothetical protein